MTPLEIVRKAIPDADFSLMQHIVYGRTPWPGEKVTVRDLYDAADRYRRAEARGRRLCDLCDRLAADGQDECVKCRAFLDEEARLRAEEYSQ